MSNDKLKSFQMELSKKPLKRTLELKNKLKTGGISKDRLPTYLMQYATLQTKTYYYYWIREKGKKWG
jgi:hypothetical protein